MVKARPRGGEGGWSVKVRDSVGKQGVSFRTNRALGFLCLIRGEAGDGGGACGEGEKRGREGVELRVLLRRKFSGSRKMFGHEGSWRGGVRAENRYRGVCGRFTWRLVSALVEVPLGSSTGFPNGTNDHAGGRMSFRIELV